MEPKEVRRLRAYYDKQKPLIDLSAETSEEEEEPGPVDPGAHSGAPREEEPVDPGAHSGAPPQEELLARLQGKYGGAPPRDRRTRRQCPQPERLACSQPGRGGGVVGGIR